MLYDTLTQAQYDALIQDDYDALLQHGVFGLYGLMLLLGVG